MSDKKSKFSGHMLPVGILGVVAGMAFLVYVPSLKAVSRAMLWFAGFHVIGAVIVGTSAYVLAGDRLRSRFRRRDSNEFNFGWETGWTIGPWIATLVLLATAIAVQVAAPGWWPLATVATLLAASFFAGGLVARTASRYEHAVLPMVNLNLKTYGVVLDAGAGSGRTTLALARAYPEATIVAVDRFDSDYIAGGGRGLMQQNLRHAGIAERVEVREGDLTRLPFEEGDFDAVISAHAMDHLGKATKTGLEEAFRVLKPGGRLLLCLWVPGWTMFAVANVLSFHLRSKASWRKIVAEVGFERLDEGMFNGYYFLLVQRPSNTRGSELTPAR